MFIATHMQELDVRSESTGGLKSYFPSPPFPSIHLRHPARPPPQKSSICGWLSPPFLLLSPIIYLPRSSDAWGPYLDYHNLDLNLKWYVFHCSFFFEAVDLNHHCHKKFPWAIVLFVLFSYFLARVESWFVNYREVYCYVRSRCKLFEFATSSRLAWLLF